MEISERTEGGVLVLAIRGDVDLESSPELRTLLKAKVAGKVPKLVIDFSAVGYIDSSGLATLIEYYQLSARDGGGKLALAGVSKRVKGAFEIVRLQEIFPFHPDVAAAVEGFQEG